MSLFKIILFFIKVGPNAELKIVPGNEPIEKAAKMIEEMAFG
tara:strand:- start:50 stop:175 length:126 start_codon:yes stop_codon:yes gene_type:complete